MCRRLAVIKCSKICERLRPAVSVLETMGYTEQTVVEYPKISLTEEYDRLLIAGDDTINRSSIIRELTDRGVAREKILPDQVVVLPGFTPDKYERLLRSDITIFSNNCAGGMLYHLFGLPFLSPTINMFMLDDSYLRFAEDPGRYLGCPLRLDRMETEGEKVYPVFALDDVELHMNHYSDPAEAEQIWYKRIRRINPENMLFMMYTDQTEQLARFLMLPYPKKVCFVPFPCNLPGAFPIPPQIDPKARFWQLVLAVADGSLPCYDLWDMLLEGKKTQIMEF